MATKKRKTTTRRSTSRKKRAEQRLPAGLGTLFAGLLLVGLAFVEGDSVWKTLHQVLFGLFGCGSFVLGAAVCCLAVLYTRGEDLLPHICKLALGLVFASGTVIVFSDIQPQGLSAFQMVAACYQNGYQAWLSGGALGAVLGGNLLLLCGRPAANFIMLVLALCVSLYIFDLTPAEVWQWLCDVSGGVHAKGVAVYEQGAARRAERRAERQAAQEAADEYDETEDLEEYEDEAEAEEPFRLGLPDWMSGVLHWGHKVTQELEQAPDSPAGAPDQPVQPQPEPQAAPAVTPVRVRASRPRAPFDVDLGPDSTEVKEGGSEPIEPFIPGPGGTFGMDPLRAAPKPTIRPIVPDAVETAAEDFFAKPEETPAAETTEQQPRPVPGDPFDTPIARPADPAEPAAAAAPIQPVMPTPQPDQPTRVSAEHAVAQRSAPDADGWISITAEPVEEKDINSLVAAAMEKPAASEQAAATAPAEEAEPVDTYQYQYPPIELFEKSKEESDPNAEDELKANAQKLVDTLESFGVRTRVLDISRGPSVTRYEVQPMAGVKISRITSLADDIALNLAVADVRMEAPIPGKPAVGIEVPNHKRSAVSIRSVFESQSFLRMTSPLGIALGKDIAGVAQVADLCKMPHLLIAGSTGSGKSVCVNSIIMSLVFRSSPEDVKLLLIDPKVVELAEYNFDRLNADEGHAGSHRAPQGGRCPGQRSPGDGAPLPYVCREQRARHQVLQQAGGGAAGSGKNALHRHRHRRAGRPDDGGGQGCGRFHLPHRSESPRRRHAPDRGHPAPQRGRHHRPDQGQHPQPHRLCCVQSGGQPHHSGWCRCRKTSGPGRYAVYAGGRTQAHPHPGHLCAG